MVVFFLQLLFVRPIANLQNKINKFSDIFHFFFFCLVRMSHSLQMSHQQLNETNNDGRNESGIDFRKKMFFFLFLFLFFFFFSASKFSFFPSSSFSLSSFSLHKTLSSYSLLFSFIDERIFEFFLDFILSFPFSYV
jgi:hypothetical protein